MKAILSVFIFILSGCSAFWENRSILCTYELVGDTSRDPRSRYYVWPSGLEARFDESIPYTLIVNNDERNIRASYDFRLSAEGGTTYLSKENIKKEPYKLIFDFDVMIDVDKVILNELVLQTESANIDIREKALVTFYGTRYRKQLDGEDWISYNRVNFKKEEEVMNFINFGIIELSNFKDEWEEIRGIRIYYNIIDVKYDNDSYFNIKYNAVFESGNETQKFNFTAKFTKIQFKLWKKLYLTV
jgi:hypothetical protein